LIEKDITLDMLKNAQKIALMNAMIDFDEIEDYSLSL
jgi:4-amino-4-deoxychorismate lyase